jgi:phosphoribosylformylglycinamidine cyclo-ligase
VFNMGTGFCCVVAAGEADTALGVLRSHYPDAAVIGGVTEEAGMVRLPGVGLVGDAGGFRPG